MIRTLMTTTAIAMLLTGGAMAQAADTNATTTATPAVGAMNWDYSPVQGDHLATKIIGMQVYSSAANDAEHIGDVNNLVVGENGEVEAVVLGVGGFLGIGEKDVAVNMDSLELVVAEDNTQRYVLATTKEALNNAQAFEWNDDNDQMAAAGTDNMAADPAVNVDQTDTAMAPADNTMAPADNANAQTDTAMAPADNTMAPANDMNADQTATGTVPADTAMAPAADGTTAMDRLDRTNMQPYDATQLTAEELIGTNVYGVDDEHIGTIGDIALNDDGSVDAIIIDFGGFLGIGTKPVAIAYDKLNFLADPDNNRSLSLPITRDQMDAAPAFDKDTYSAQRDTQRVMLDANAQS